MGWIFSELRDGSGGPPLLGRCVLSAMTRGRVEFRTLGLPLRSLVVTGQEAEALHPILEVGAAAADHAKRLEILSRSAT